MIAGHAISGGGSTINQAFDYILDACNIDNKKYKNDIAALKKEFENDYKIRIFDNLDADEMFEYNL